MSDEGGRNHRLELLLARLLDYGSWLASAVIGLGLALALIDWRSGAQAAGSLPSMRIVTAGIALFVLLPVLRVTLMLIVFVRERDYRFVAITALVLIIILAGFMLGIYMKSPTPA
jgi:Protein of unknown function (DUF1634)